MREPRVCVEIRQRLARHGLPAARIERVVGELVEHWEDLEEEALQNGLPPETARAQANERLGTPERLAADAIASFRQSSMLGRHPIVALCLLPLLLPPLLMAAVVLPLYWLNEVTHFASWVDPTRRPDAELVAGTLWVIYYASLVLSVTWLCRRSWRAGLGVRWIMAICLWCTLTALARYFDADAVDRTVALGVTFPWRLSGHTAAVLCLNASAAAWFAVAARKEREALTDSGLTLERE